MSFIEELRSITSQGQVVTLDKIKEAARQALPQQYRRTPWVLTRQGGSGIGNTIYTEEI
ncbi:MAG: hypothetical protein IKR25_05975 [Muribaculaceae bacterium]|nr:hypothetical protein [Muribaculaceae bacterium]